MPSRDVTLLCLPLQIAWTKGCAKFAEYYPELTPFLTCTYRSPEEQDADYAIGRTVPGKDVLPSRPMGRIVTNAKRWESPHNYTPAEAFDYSFRNVHGNAIWEQKYYTLFANIVLHINPELVWGGTFKKISDGDHIETKTWKSNARG